MPLASYVTSGSGSVTSTSAIRALVVASQPGTRYQPPCGSRCVRHRPPTTYRPCAVCTAGEVQLDSRSHSRLGVTLRQADHLPTPQDRNRELVEPAGLDALDVVLHDRERVRVTGRDVADVRASCRRTARDGSCPPRGTGRRCHAGRGARWSRGNPPARDPTSSVREPSFEGSPRRSRPASAAAGEHHARRRPAPTTITSTMTFPSFSSRMRLQTESGPRPVLASRIPGRRSDPGRTAAGDHRPGPGRSVSTPASVISRIAVAVEKETEHEPRADRRVVLLAPVRRGTGQAGADGAVGAAGPTDDRRQGRRDRGLQRHRRRA